MRRKAAVAVLWVVCVAASWASFAYASGDTVSAPYGTIITTLLGIGGTYFLMRRKNNAEATNLDADTIDKKTRTIAELSDQVDVLLKQRSDCEDELREMRQQIRDADDRAERLETEVKELREEVERLTAALRPGRKTDPDVVPRLPIRR